MLDAAPHVGPHLTRTRADLRAAFVQREHVQDSIGEFEEDSGWNFTTIAEGTGIPSEISESRTTDKGIAVSSFTSSSPTGHAGCERQSQIPDRSCEAGNARDTWNRLCLQRGGIGETHDASQSGSGCRTACSIALALVHVTSRHSASRIGVR